MTKHLSNTSEVFYTGGGIWLAEMNLGDGTYAVIDSEYNTALCIYRYSDDEPYMSEDMVFCDEVQNLDSEHLKIYNQLYEALKKEVPLD